MKKFICTFALLFILPLFALGASLEEPYLSPKLNRNLKKFPHLQPRYALLGDQPQPVVLFQDKTGAHEGLFSLGQLRWSTPQAILEPAVLIESCSDDESVCRGDIVEMEGGHLSWVFGVSGDKVVTGGDGGFPFARDMRKITRFADADCQNTLSVEELRARCKEHGDILTPIKVGCMDGKAITATVTVLTPPPTIGLRCVPQYVIEDPEV